MKVPTHVEFRAAVEFGRERGEPGRFEKGENIDPRLFVTAESTNGFSGDFTAIIFLKGKGGDLVCASLHSPSLLPI